MTRLYFHVRHVAAHWEVQPANAGSDEIPAQFPSEAEAVAFAMHLARAVWRGTLHLTGVRLLFDGSDVVEVLRCGEDGDDC